MVLTKEDKADVARLVAVCVILQALQACVVGSNLVFFRIFESSNELSFEDFSSF